MDIYIASIEVKALPGSQMFSESSMGGFVCCLISARTKNDAKQILLKCLVEDRYDLIELEYLELFEDVEFDDDELAADFESCIQELKNGGQLAYTTFYAYERLDS